MWQQPDSALSCLIAYLDTCGEGMHTVFSVTQYDRHYAQLLLAESLYKNYCEQTNRAALRQAASYLDSLHCTDAARNVSAVAFLDARAHYINGVGYYERDSVVEACKEYLTALEVMETHFEEKELTGIKAQFMALAYNRLTVLFSNLYLHEQAIYFGKLSLHYYNKYEPSPWHLVWTLNNIGSHYDVLDNYDSAYLYYNQGLRVLHDTNSLSYRDVATHLAYLSYKEGKPVELSLNQLRTIIASVESEKEYYSRCLTIGEIFYHDAQYDSARYYFKKVFVYTQSEDSKRLAAERLIEINKLQGIEQASVISEFTDYLIPFANQEEIKSSVKSQLTEQYNSFNQRRLEHKHQMEKKKNLKWAMGVLVAFLAVLSVTAFLYHNSKRKRQGLEEMLERQQSEAIRKTRALLAQRVSDLYHSKLPNRLERIIDEFDEAYPNAMVRLAHAHPDLNHTELNLLVLNSLGFRAKEEADLLKLSENTVMQYRSNLRKKTGNVSVSELLR